MGKKATYDFGGWATVNNKLCSDGRTIRSNAFADNDGHVVPLVWNHQHNDPTNVLGHALLENREDGVYAYCTLNDSEAGKTAKELVKHGDVKALSIYANKLKQQGGNVLHGVIREVSLVLAGANPGAYIDSILLHSDETAEDLDAVIFMDEKLELMHSDEKKEEKEPSDAKTEEPTMEKEKEKTVQDVIDEMTDEQKDVVYFLIGQAVEDAQGQEEDYEEEDDENVKHNVFDYEDDNDYNAADTLTHSEMEEIMSDARRYGSLKDAVLQHGITNLEFLFPDATTLETTPGFITNNNGWVSNVMSSTHHTPFSRIKSIFANLTEEDARAKGYIKGNKKKDEVFTLLKRQTTPQTIYKKQKLDRDDVVDINSFDVVAWLKAEMRLMLDEEIARAILVGDGRNPSSDEKINEANIRPVWNDDDLYTIKADIEVEGGSAAKKADIAKAFIRSSIKARKDYKGSGDPTLYIGDDILTECLLLEDNTGRPLYDSISKLATTLRVKEIVSVPIMDGLQRTDKSQAKHNLLGLIVNLTDYNVGADQGGAVNMFDDFDIDYNQQKYLIETRCSGALIKPYSAIAIEHKVS